MRIVVVVKVLPSDRDHERARELVLRYGWNATAYQILNPGIQLWFPRAGDAVIGFVEHARSRVVGGAPVCDVSRLEAVAAEFKADADEHGRRVCYFGAGERLDASLAARPGWSRVLLGAQPVWDTRNWPSASERRSSLRAQFHRARNKGVTITEWPPEFAVNHPALRRCLGEWLATRHLPPLHFMVEPETLRDLRDRRVFVAKRGTHGVVGFTILSPVPARHGWLVEQIVRGRGAPNGTAELLIDFAMRAAAASGASYATLGLSPLSDRAPVVPLRQPLWLRLLLQWVRLHGARFYNFVGLEAFKAKFNPEVWEPIYAIAEGSSFSPRDLYAIAAAFSGGAPLRLVARALAKAAWREAKTMLGRIRHSA
ncbi:MAG: phosphatidylglycerol lysyltransferase domain-containing protein [Gemmatimonadaceae bacterium]